MPDASCTSLGDDLYLIDARLSGEPHRLACYLFDTPERVLVDCGPSLSIGHLFAALQDLGIDDVATLAFTHIHLDHAGGAGHFAARFPRARLAVHTLGLPHLADPARLLASATRAFGERSMREEWGTVRPVERSRLIALDEGSRLPLGGGRSLEVLATPGHARHHVVFFEADRGICLLGDQAGVAFPPSHLVQPATPAPDFDGDAVVEHLRRIAARRPALLAFSHFGPHPDPPAALAAAEQGVRDWVSWVERASGAEDAAAGFRHWVLGAYRAAGIPEDEVARYDRHTAWPTQVAGIRRWLEHRPQPA